MAISALYLTLNPNRQSTTVSTEGWFRYLPPRGLRPVLVSRELKAFHRWSVEQGIPSYQDDLPFPDRRRPLPFLRSLWKLIRIVKRHRVQLIHCNEQEVYPIGACLGFLCRLPVVVTVHFRMDRAYCAWAFKGSWAPSRMFFVSARNLEACRPSLEGIVPEQAWRVIHNGLDLDRYRPDIELGRAFRERHHLPFDAVLIGAACAFRERKQLEHLFEAAANLAARDVHVVLAGFKVGGEEDYADQLLASARQRLGHRFHMVGELSDLRGFGNALDLFVNTSREESFGLSVLEAMACGCPVVGYDSKAVDEVVLPGGGEIVRQDDVRALTEAIVKWTTEPILGASSRAAARQQAEGFDLRVLSERLWREYESVLSGSKD